MSVVLRRGSTCPLSRAVDGCIARRGTTSLCQSAVTSKIVKRCCSRVFSCKHSDVNKDLGLKAKAKDSDPKAKDKAKDLRHKAKAKGKDSRYQGQIFHRSSTYSVHHLSSLMLCECFYVRVVFHVLTTFR